VIDGSRDDSEGKEDAGTDSDDRHYQQMHLLWSQLRFGCIHFVVADVIKGLSLIMVVLQSSNAVPT
jgi:hypothetical protein